MSSPFLTSIPEKVKHLPDRISSALKNKQVLLTGASGFLGKVLLEKLLRTIENVKIYILIRPKKNKSSKERLTELFKSPLFDALKQIHNEEEILRKVIPINGDVLSPDLGISREDRQTLIDNVHIVYHIAATVRFDDLMQTYILLNTRGTRSMLQLSKEMKNLELFVYVSTAYCHPKESVLEEKTYPPPTNPHKVIEKAELLTKDELELLKPELLQDFPNGYAFTKCLCEGIVSEYMEAGMPCMILRPSIIIPIWKEPLPGWTDNINGPTGLLIGAGKGIIRTMYCNYATCADFLPVDILINGMLLSTWNFLHNKGNTKRVINLTANKDFQITWYDIIENGKDIARNRVPLNNVLWYPGGSMTNSKLFFHINAFFCHTIPSYLLDGLISLGGYEPVLKRVHDRIKKGFDIFEYYTRNQWSFKNDNLHALRDGMNEKEIIKYEISIFKDLEEAIDYFEMCTHGARQYLLGEKPDTLPAARRHMKIMYVIHIITQFLFFALFLWILSKLFL